MKAVLALCVTALVASSLAKTPEQKAAIMAKKKECQEKVGATEDDLKLLMPPYAGPFTDGAKKIEACFAKEFKTMVDGKLSKDGALEFYRKMLSGESDDEKKMEAVKGVIDKCAAEVNADTGKSEEDTAIHILQCISAEASAKGLLDHH